MIILADLPRTMTKTDFRTWSATQRIKRNKFWEGFPTQPIPSPAERQASLWSLHAQIHNEVQPIINEREKILSLNKKPSVAQIIRECATSIPTPPPIQIVSLTSLSDKPGPKQAAALATLNTLPPELIERLDQQRKKRYPNLHLL